MEFQYNLFNRTEPSDIYLYLPGRKLYCVLNGVDESTVSLVVRGNNTSTIDFEVFKEVEGVLSNGYDLLDEMLEIYCLGMVFKLTKAPQISFNGDYEKKIVSAETSEIELQQYPTAGLEINAGTAGSLEMTEENLITTTDGAKLPKDNITFCNFENEKLSLLHLVLDYAQVPDWKVGYIDDSIDYYNICTMNQSVIVDTNGNDILCFDDSNVLLKDMVAKFSEESGDVYSFLTQTVAGEFNCIFVFDSLNYLINAYRVDGLGKDTNIVVSNDNLSNTLERTRDNNLVTQFTISGGEDDEGVGVKYWNFGSSVIEDLSYMQKFLSKELNDKYDYWKTYRESFRSEYIYLSKRYNTLLTESTEIRDRVPLDADSDDFDTFTDEELEDEKDLYISIINAIYTTYDYANVITNADGTTNYQVDNDGFYILKNEYRKKDTTISDNSTVLCSARLKSQMKEDRCWYSYFQYRYNVYENILIAEINNTIADEDNKKDSITAWETEWELYGVTELEIKLKSYKNSYEVLEKQGFGDNYQNTVDVDISYAGQMHDKYLEYKKLYTDCQNALNKRQAELDTVLKEQDDVDARRTAIVTDVEKTNSRFGFTDSELNILKHLYNQNTYTNENFYIPSTATPDEEVEIQGKLFREAVEQLYVESHPQYTYEDEIENLYAMNEFKDFHEQLDVFNFIRVEVAPDVYEKLRVIEISFNPCTLENDLTVSFTSMIQYKSKRNDLASLLDNATRSSRESSIIGTGGNSNTTFNIDASVIRLLLKSAAMTDKINQVVSESIKVASGTFDVLYEKNFTADAIIAEIIHANKIAVNELTAKVVVAEKIIADVIESDEIKANLVTALEGNFETIIANYVDADYINANLIIADNADFQNLTALVANIQNLMAGNAGIGDLQVINITAANAVIDEAFIKEQIAAKITVADLQAQTATASIIALINDETGNPSIAFAGSTQQFYDSDGNVRVQIGQDSTGDFNFIVRGADGQTALFDASGITTAGVPDGLIVNDMLADTTISKEKINFPIIEPNEQGGIDITQIYDGQGGLFGTEYTNFVNSMQEKTDGLDQKIDDSLEYDIFIGSSNGNFFKNGNIATTLTCYVYKGNEDVTDTFDDSAFIWNKKNNDGTLDTTWNTAHSSGTKTIDITNDDVNQRATFECYVTGVS